MSMTRRGFLKGLLATSAATTLPFSFAVSSSASEEPIILATPEGVKITSNYATQYLAYLVTADVRLGRVTGETATIDKHISVSLLCDDYEANKEEINKMLVDRLDEYLSKEYGKGYKVIKA